MVRYLKPVFILILLLFFLELGLRFLNPPALSYYRNIKLLHRYHPDYYVSLGSNLDIYIKHNASLWEGRFTTNSLGFRGSPEPNPKLPKIACLGDSLVMGFGVSDEDTFCSQLNGFKLNEIEYQSMNLAVDAYGSLGSAKRLKESFTKIEIETVLFFVSPNDFTVPPGLVEQGVLPDDIVEKERENDESYRRKFFIQFELTRFSYLLHALKLAKEQLEIKRLFALKDLETELESMLTPLTYIGSAFYKFPKTECKDNLQTGTNMQLDKSENTPNENKIHEISQSENQPLLSEGFKACLEKQLPDSECLEQAPHPSNLPELPKETVYAYNILLDSIQENGANLIVVFIPMQNEDIRCSNSKKHSPLYEYAMRAKYFFESRGIPTYELINDSEEICPIEEFFIPNDGHLTKRGNKWVGDKLKMFLKEFYSKHSLKSMSPLGSLNSKHPLHSLFDSQVSKGKL